MMTSGLNKPALVLNKGWQAHNAVPVKEALCDVISGRAKIIHPETYQLHDIGSWLEEDPGDNFIKTSSFDIKVPEVIIFDSFSKMPDRKIVFSRKNLWKRDGYRCQYCGVKPSADEITMDHVLPRKQGGTSTFENCVLACLKCNVGKGNQTPEQAGLRLRQTRVNANGEVTKKFYYRPVKPRWNPMYSMPRITVFPDSWKNFLKTKDSELYWNAELEP